MMREWRYSSTGSTTAPMRSAVLAGLLLVACSAPAGGTVDECDSSWREIESVIVTPGGSAAGPVPIDCMRRVDQNRVRIGFRMPPGPTCYRLSEVRVLESADAVSITLIAARDDNPTAGACPETPPRTTTEVDLQAPVADRTLLDGSMGE